MNGKEIGQKISYILKSVASFLSKKPWLTTFVGFIILGLIGAFIFYFRYPFAFQDSNFYAEDGSVFIKNLLEKGPVLGSLTAFNGYLIVGEYLVGVLGIIINFLVGGDFITLAKALAVASYLFLGFACALPWLLFRTKFGFILTIIVFFALCLTPLGAYDSAVIGTIGNLKFAFLFIALLLIVYRNDASLSSKGWQILLIDLVLLLCVTTNIVVVGILPFMIIRYLPSIKKAFIKKSLKVFYTYGFMSIVALAIIAFAYVLIVYIKGIPEIPGYLEGELHYSALLSIIYRSTVYGITFPISYLFNDWFAVISLLAFVSILFYKKAHRGFALTVTAALFVNVAGFVYNRPGVTDYFVNYQQTTWPGHFFYGGTMIVIFAVAYIFATKFRALNLSTKTALLACGIIGLLLFLPATGNTKTNPYTLSAARPTLASEIETVCKSSNSNKDVRIQIYPNYIWNMVISKQIACEKV